VKSQTIGKLDTTAEGIKRLIKRGYKRVEIAQQTSRKRIEEAQKAGIQRAEVLQQRFMQKRVDLAAQFKEESKKRQQDMRVKLAEQKSQFQNTRTQAMAKRDRVHDKVLDRVSKTAHKLPKTTSALRTVGEVVHLALKPSQ
jgi:hypothetical protein